MNAVVGFIRDNWQRLGLQGEISPDQLTTLMLTPRFRASNHLIYLVLPKMKARPILVAKIPRQQESSGLAQEARNLTSVQNSRDGGYSSIPRLMAYEPFVDRTILVETALVGRPMDPPMIRKNLHACCDRTMNWLVDLHENTRVSSYLDSGWYTRLIERPLNYFEKYFPILPEELRLLEDTRTIVGHLREADLPLVFEHGDLSHPNLLLINEDQLGVLDWETARINGLPFCDAFFFLNYAATSFQQTKTDNDYLRAFKEAFFDPQSWVVPYVEFYSTKLLISPAIASSLFVFCWARYTIGLLERILGEKPDQSASPNNASWLRLNRFYRLWQYSVTNFEKLSVFQK